MKRCAPQLARRTDDPRLLRLKGAVDDMSMGRFDIEVPSANDGVGRLGQSLDRLASTLAKRLDRVLRLMRLFEGIHAALTMEDALDYLYYSFRSVVPFDRVGCSLLSEDERRTTAVWVRSKGSVQALLAGYSAPLAGSSLERVLLTREPRVLNDLEAYLDAHPDSESTRLIVSEGMRSSLTCPIFALRRPVGFLFFSSKERDAYRREHVEFYQQTSRALGTVIERTRLYEDLTRARDALQESNGKLRVLVDLDALTMVPNRRAFDQRLDLEYRRAERSALPLTVLMIDIDDFKAFNDRYGHPAGDECLRKVAGSLVSSMRRAGDFVARLGGEEFAVLLPNTDTRQSASAAERCLDAIRELRIPHEGARSARFLTLSVGAATWSGTTEASASELVARADVALYQAKQRGRNTSSLAPSSDGPEKSHRARGA